MLKYHIYSPKYFQSGGQVYNFIHLFYRSYTIPTFISCDLMDRLISCFAFLILLALHIVHCVFACAGN